MDMGMDMGMNMNPMEGMMGEMGGMMGMDPAMQGAMQGMMENMMPGQEYMMPGQEYMMPGQENMMPGQEYMMPGQENMMPGQEYMMPGQNNQIYGNELLENNIPGQNEFLEEEEEGYGGEMWNGIFYGPGQEFALNQARIDFPNGWMNGGMGEGGGGNPGPGLGAGSNILAATPALDMLMGTPGEQDTFVFTLQDIEGYGSIYDPNPGGALQTNSTNADQIMNFDPSDGDAIKIESFGSPIPVATIASNFSIAPGLGGYAFYQNGTSGVVFTTNDTDLENFNFSNFTDVV